MDGIIFVGNVKARTTPWGDTEHKIGLKIEDLRTLEEHVVNGWINLVLSKSKSGKPYLKIDTYGIKKQKEQERQPEPAREHRYEKTDDPVIEGDIPF